MPYERSLQLAALNRLISVYSNRLLVIGYRLSVISYRLSVIGYRHPLSILFRDLIQQEKMGRRRRGRRRRGRRRRGRRRRSRKSGGALRRTIKTIGRKRRRR